MVVTYTDWLFCDLSEYFHIHLKYYVKICYTQHLFEKQFQCWFTLQIPACMVLGWGSPEPEPNPDIPIGWQEPNYWSHCCIFQDLHREKVWIRCKAKNWTLALSNGTQVYCLTAPNVAPTWLCFYRRGKYGIPVKRKSCKCTVFLHLTVEKSQG